MKDNSRFLLDVNKGKIFFKGNCFEVLHLCKALCCRRVNATLSLEEIRSNFYKAEAFCIVTNRECKNKEIDCADREYRLKRKKNDNTCIYLTRDNKCAINERKPQNCKDFYCKEGWGLLYPSEELARKAEKRTNKYFIENLRDDMVFVLNPLIRVETLFYVKEKKEILFVNKRIDKCGFVSSKYNFHSPARK